MAVCLFVSANNFDLVLSASLSFFFFFAQVMQAELLPLLESEDAQESTPASLYRAIYTLLGEGCERFPVLVNDEEPSSRFDTEVLAPGLEDNVCAIRNEF